MPASKAYVLFTCITSNSTVCKNRSSKRLFYARMPTLFEFFNEVFISRVVFRRNFILFLVFTFDSREPCHFCGSNIR